MLTFKSSSLLRAASNFAFFFRLDGFEEYASDVVGLGGKLIIHTIDGLELTLTQKMMVDGIQKYLDDGGFNYPFHNTQPDAYTYDTILQNALFKEVVYG